MENSGMLIALNIRKLRAGLNWTQSELAERANLSLRGIQAIETQGRAPRAETLSQIAEALGVSVGELYRDPNEASIPVSSYTNKASLIGSISMRLPTLNEEQLETVLSFVNNIQAATRTDSAKIAKE